MNTELDGDEYLHLALHASGKGDHHAALTYLKSALQIDARNALALYMLAAQHAELGLYQRARQEFREVLEINPDMEIARFQLGLLHIQLDEIDAARAMFEHLAEFTADTALRSFSRGLLALAADRRDDARALIGAGLAHCSNEPLKADMQKILTRLDAQAGTAPQPVAEPVPAERKTATGSIFLGAYRNAPDGKA